MWAGRLNLSLTVGMFSRNDADEGVQIRFHLLHALSRIGYVCRNLFG